MSDWTHPTEKIRTAAELDALVHARAFVPDVQEVINDDAGDDPDPQWVYDRLVESLAVIDGLTAALSAPAPAPSVVPEAAVEALREWGVDEGDVAALREAAIEAVAWKLIDRTSDLADRGPSDETVQAALTDARAALPLMTAAPSATRDEVVDALVMTRLSDYAGTDMAVITQTADRLLARFDMTRKGTGR